MIGSAINHYKILDKSRPERCSGRGSSFHSLSGTGLGEGGMGVVYKAQDTKLENSSPAILREWLEFSEFRRPVAGLDQERPPR